jgi:hypothetical protein
VTLNVPSSITILVTLELLPPDPIPEPEKPIVQKEPLWMTIELTVERPVSSPVPDPIPAPKFPTDVKLPPSITMLETVEFPLPDPIPAL